MSPRVLGRIAPLLLVFALASPPRAAAYSVLAHEAMVDAAWDDTLAPLLRAKFPRAPADAVQRARAYAYGGCLIQDLGYYPFGSHFFSNLVHYVRSGDFVEALVRDARDVNEYAFALGALAHYASDNSGHPIAVNRVVPILYPKLRAKVGDEALYADSPARHIMAEFAFDVLQVARGSFTADTYQDLIGFEVAMPVLERAFHDTYGLDLKDVFGDEDLAIGTYRWAASRVIPEITRVAWTEKRDEIMARTPDVTERTFVYTMTRGEYERAFGAAYRKPGFFARLVVAIFKIVPKFGPFRPLAFQPLTRETEAMFLESFDRAQARYRTWASQIRAGRLSLADADLDTGKPPARGANPLADETYAELVGKLAKTKKPVALPSPLREALNEHYAAAPSPRPGRGDTGKIAKRDRDAIRKLAALNAAR